MGAVFDSLFTELRQVLNDPGGVRYNDKLIENALNWGIKTIYLEAPINHKVYFLKRMDITVSDFSNEYTLPSNFHIPYVAYIFEGSLSKWCEIILGRPREIDFPAVFIYDNKFRVRNNSYPVVFSMDYIAYPEDYQYGNTSNDVNLIFANLYKQKIFDLATEFIYKTEAKSV